ncbi:carboxypeptidase M32 [Pyrococcus abyssi]|uniref:Metal-dependent carboxypeptidase n=1 Tax=Pyrococcus abyssi (strain GE5 / Orsay) TaxID=272844 RepID=Q9UYD7_PYRAB|nr:carboxypeptidase M32 [Pyrococcus abyssi]CAB50475.1 Thermostable carboxypeptidase [Pyrococcus abyssi GE5]CCE71028.1 TPA: thermostable carboxypeptidase [Pyrococcus abyssi GE5]
MEGQEVFKNETIKKILEKYRRIWALGHAQSVLGWDLEVNMPKEGILERSVAQGELSVLSQELLLKPYFVELVEKAKGIEDLNEYERGVVRVLDRQIRIMKSFPPEFLREVSETTSKATKAWEEAKAKDDFSKFEPWLDKIIELAKKAAEYLGYEEEPYDALLDLYEEGLRTRDVVKMFEVLEKKLRPLLDKILEEGKVPREHELEKEKYEREWMERVNLWVLEKFGYPLGTRARLDVSAHPFTTEFGIRDVRITTRYEGFDFRRTLLSTVHEFGHALYELQQDERFMFTPIAGGVSLGIHESQSRFWENIIGRSREFVELIYPVLKENLPFIDKYTQEDVYLYFNMVRPDFIRTEADVVTYNFHIILRFKLERLMVSEEVKAGDLPEMWNEEMERLLGIRPKSYKEGILQDIHWAHGSIGYFPTYSIGTILSAQLYYHIKRDIPDFEEKVAKGEFEPIKVWLREKIHRWGSIYPPKELLRRAIGEEMDAEYFIRWIEERYL